MSHAAQVPNPPATVVVAVPLRELVELDALPSVALASWTCVACAVWLARGRPRQRPTGTPPRI